MPHPQRIVGTTKIGFNHTNNVNISYCISVLCIWHKIEPNNSLKVQKINTKYFSPMLHQMDGWPCYSSIWYHYTKYIALHLNQRKSSFESNVTIPKECREWQYHFVNAKNRKQRNKEKQDKSKQVQWKRT